jgi:hypothetical protein
MEEKANVNFRLGRAGRAITGVFGFNVKEI